MTIVPVQRPTITLPPAPGFEWARLRQAWVPDDPFQPDDAGQIERYYATKAAIAAWLRPRSVVEIGVRAGYSALAFFMGHPFEMYTGLDADLGHWGGVKGYLTHASAMIRREFGRAACQSIVQRADTQRLTVLPAERFDLAHVDGDHGWQGATHDITLCLDAGTRYVCVDDYEFVPAVRAAAEDVVSARGLEAVFVSDGGYRGNLIIPNDGVPLPDA